MTNNKKYTAITLIALALTFGAFNIAYATNAACELSISASSIEEGQSIEVTWSSEWAISGVLTPGDIALDPLSQGSMTLTPTADTTYSATFESENGATATCEASVNVTPPLPPPPPPPPAETPVCSIPQIDGRIIVDLEMEVLYASKSADDAEQGPFVIDLPEGTYTVTLESFDNHDDKGGQGQVNEQWHLELNDSNGVVATTGVIDDLPADQNILTQVVNTELVVPSSVSSVTAFHSFYPDSNINSIRPLCAAFDPLSIPPPPPPPPPPSSPQCLIEEQEGRIIVDLGTGVLVSHTSEAASKKGPFPVTLEAGEYEVTLSSYDDHIGKPGQDQPNEQWHLELIDQSDSLVATTGIIDDLPDDQDTLVQVVDTNLVIATDISSVIAIHSFYPDPNPNSIVPSCVAFDLIPPPPPPGEPFCTLSADATFVDDIGTVEITWTSDLTVSGVLNPGNISLDPLSGGSVTVTATVDTDYVATFETSDGDTLTCEASIEVPPPPPPPGCTSGCGGGFTPPEIVLIQKSEPPLESLAFVTLSQIPYTGFPAGPVGTALFWTLLILLSGVIAYFMSVKGIGPAYVFTRFANKHTRLIREEDIDIKVAEQALPLGEFLPMADKDLSLDSYDAGGEGSTSDENPGSLLEKNLEEHAADSDVLISEDGVKYLLHSSLNDEHVAYTLLDKAVAGARALYPREDGWLHLNRERLVSILSEPTHGELRTVQTAPVNLPHAFSPAPTQSQSLPRTASVSSSTAASSQDAQSTSAFIGWLCEGDGDKIFEFLRTLNSTGRSSREFLTGVLRMFDEIYRQRLEGGRNVDSSALLYTQQLSKEDLEQLMDLLAVGVDHSYRQSHTGVKMALVRALDYIHTKGGVAK